MSSFAYTLNTAFPIYHWLQAAPRMEVPVCAKVTVIEQVFAQE